MAIRDLEAFVDETIKISRQYDYHPTTFISMRQRHGTINAIERLVMNGDVQSGFKRLNQLGLIDYTIEAAVLRFPNEFSRAARECAEFRLRLVRNQEDPSRE